MEDSFIVEKPPPTLWEVAHAYDVLGLPQTATRQDVELAARRLARVTHPDRPGGSSERYAEVVEAEKLVLKQLEKPLRPSDLAATLARVAHRRWFLQTAFRYYPRPAKAPPAQPTLSLVRVTRVKITPSTWLCQCSDGVERSIPRSPGEPLPHERAVITDEGLRLWFFNNVEVVHE